MNKNTIIIILAIVISSLITYIISSKNTGSGISEQQFRKLSREKSSSKKGEKGEEDPYIAGQVKNTIVKKFSEIQKCYNAFLETKPKVKDGLVTIDWQISVAGEVMNPEMVNTQFNNKDFESCITKTIAKWTFPPPPFKEAKYIAHKFRFKNE